MPDLPDVLKTSMAEELLIKTGSIRLRVLGQSMLPAIWPGDILTIEKWAAAEIEPGDIALLRRNGRFIIHRIRDRQIGEGCLHFLTRGDSTTDNDPPFAEKALLGKVLTIERQGRATIPSRRLSVFRGALAWIFARCDLARNFALRLQRMHQKAGMLNIWLFLDAESQNGL